MKGMSYPPNLRGLYDMAGNVSEWTADRCDKSMYFSKHRNHVHYLAAGAAKRLDDIFEFQDSDDIETIIQKLRDCGHFTPEWMDPRPIPSTGQVLDAPYLQENTPVWVDTSKQHYQTTAEAIHHELNVFKNTPNPRVVKGGSWDDGLLYLRPSNREIYSEQTSSSKIGFRVAMTITREMYPYFMPRK